MNNEIKEIIEYFKDDIDYLEEALKYPNFKGRYITIRDKECEYLRKLLDYITKLQLIEQEYSPLLSENAELENKITNLQEKNEDLREENKRLGELCNKYEEEHSTAFNLWKMRMEEMPTYEEKEDYKSRCEKAIEYLGINEEILETCEIYDVNGIEVYKILQGNKWNEVERAYLDDKPIGDDKE